MIYGVYYYDFIINSTPTVYLCGLYNDIEEAKIKIKKIIPNYKNHINNTVRNDKRIGWINEYKLGDCKIDNSSLIQPHNSINLFNDQNI